MRIGTLCLALSVLAGLAAPARGEGEPLKGRYGAFVDAAAACAAATGPKGVDRSVVAAAGWPSTGSAATDDMIVSAAYSRANPFVLRINATSPLEPEGCWLSADFRGAKDFAEVRRRLEGRFGRAPDETDGDEMRGTRWNNPGNVAELWMMPKHKLCPGCPTLFFSVRPRSPK